jgi:hypothetical protein
MHSRLSRLPNSGSTSFSAVQPAALWPLPALALYAPLLSSLHRAARSEQPAALSGFCPPAVAAQDELAWGLAALRPERLPVSEAS